MPIQGEVKVLAPGKRRKKEPVAVQEVRKVEQPSDIFVLKDSKYHDDMFNLDSKKSN